MEVKNRDLYSSAHLFVSAIRVYEHQNNTPPSVADVCQMLSISIERGNLICRKLKDIGALDEIEGSYGCRIFIRDHMKIEEIPRGQDESRLGEELKKFQEAQKGFSQKIESFQTKQAQKKKTLFAEMEKKLKHELDKK
jgi:hypothetical protein